MASTTLGTSGPLLQPRISITAFRIATIVTFILALVAVTCRFVASISQGRRPRLDDVFLVFATICLITGTTLVLVVLDAAYFVEDLELNGIGAANTVDLDGLIDKITYYRKMDWAFFVITWNSIFFVKFSFLSFFSGLCDRLPRMELYRRVAYGLCVLSWMWCIAQEFVACPYLGLDATQCATPENVNRTINIGLTSMALDMATDLSIVLIPIILLRKVRMRLFQKIAIGVFLCLSLVMIVFAIVRATGIHIGDGKVDGSWSFFWQQMEASTAVTMISVTAFRSVVSQSASSRDKPWEASIPHFIRKFRNTWSTSEEGLHLDGVIIPGATMTGMGTALGSIEGDETLLDSSSTEHSVSQEQADLKFPNKAFASS